MTNNQHAHKSQEGEEKYDIFRDSPLRYLGYANEVGESFRYQFPRLVVPSYVLAFGYCLADASTSGYNAYCNTTTSTTSSSTAAISSSSSSEAFYEAARATTDTLLWQSLASVAIPGATINLIVKAARFAVRRSPLAIPALVAKWVPTSAGLASIPVIIQPIDAVVDYGMDHSFRQMWKAKESSSA